MGYQPSNEEKENTKAILLAVSEQVFKVMQPIAEQHRDIEDSFNHWIRETAKRANLAVHSPTDKITELSDAHSKGLGAMFKATIVNPYTDEISPFLAASNALVAFAKHFPTKEKTADVLDLYKAAANTQQARETLLEVLINTINAHSKELEGERSWKNRVKVNIGAYNISPN